MNTDELGYIPAATVEFLMARIDSHRHNLPALYYDKWFAKVQVHLAEDLADIAMMERWTEIQHYAEVQIDAERERRAAFDGAGVAR